MNRNEYIGKITSLLSFLTDNQVKYIYFLMEELFTNKESEA